MMQIVFNSGVYKVSSWSILCGGLFAANNKLSMLCLSKLQLREKKNLSKLQLSVGRKHGCWFREEKEEGLGGLRILKYFTPTPQVAQVTNIR